jgi:hypothetical protein
LTTYRSMGAALEPARGPVDTSNDAGCASGREPASPLSRRRCSRRERPARATDPSTLLSGSLPH